AEFHHLYRAPRPVRHRDWSGAGRGCLAGDGTGVTRASGSRLRRTPAGLGRWLPARGSVLVLRARPVGLAAALLLRWATRPARAAAPGARGRSVRDAVLGAGGVGCDPGAHHGARAQLGARLRAGLRLPVRRGPRRRVAVHRSAARRAPELPLGHGPVRGDRVRAGRPGGRARARAPGSGVRTRRPLAFMSMPTFVKATQAYQQGQRTLPGRYYTAPDVFAEEQERIFARRWVCVGRMSELANPGDYVQRIVAGESIIVVRGQDGTVRAFYNVCRHRGTRLCDDSHGHLSETI